MIEKGGALGAPFFTPLFCEFTSKTEIYFWQDGQ